MRSLVARTLSLVLSLAVLVGSGVRPAAAQTVVGPDDPPDLAARARAGEAYGHLPLSFEANHGQTDSSVDFVAHGRGYRLLLSATQAVMQLRPEQAETPTQIGLHLLDADGQAPVAGLDPLPGTANYFLGSDPAQWHTDIPTYARVQYAGVYPGIDLVYYGNQGQLENDFVVAPGSDPGLIRLGVAGADDLQVDAAGDLVLGTRGGQLRLQAPLLYQEGPHDRQTVAGGYTLDDLGDVGFAVGVYDANRPLIIDPVLVYSTFLGGAGQDEGRGIAVDAAGNAYVTGLTGSGDFPTTPGAFQRTFGSGVVASGDAFVTKLNPTGTALVYSTFLGGSNFDESFGIAVDTAGNAYVTGRTTSADFPTTPGAFQPAFSGVDDAFVSKLNPTGTALVYSTFLGGSSSELSQSIAVDSASNAYVTGVTQSADFPTTPGAFQRTFSGGLTDAFVSELNPTGSALVYSTYLGGGSGQDPAAAITVDAAGNAYIAGSTFSRDFPTTPGAFQPTFRGDCGSGVSCTNSDGFVSKLNPAGTALVYSTFLGGSSSDAPSGIALDASGNAYLIGTTASADFPTTPGAFRPTLGGFNDAFVTKLNSTGTALVYSTLLGGSSIEEATKIALDAAGNAYVTGATFSRDFPITPGAFQATCTDCDTTTQRSDAFVTELNPAGTALVSSTYLGGNGGDSGQGIALDAAGNTYVTGFTESADFPTTPGAFQRTFRGGFRDVFVAKIAPAASGDVTAPVTVAAVNPQPNAAGFNRTDVTVTLTATDNTGGSGVKSITFSATGAQTIASTSVAGSTATVAISAEGVTTLSFFAIDNAGNTEAAKTLVVRIDKTAPEARVQFDPARRDIVVLGTDTLSGVPAGPIAPISVTRTRDEDHDNEQRAELRTFLIQDAAGNSLRLVLKVRIDDDQARAQVVSLQINGGAVITPAQNSLRVEFERDKAGKLEQEVRVGDGKDRQTAEAHFDARDNQTRIELKQGGTEQKVTRPGLVLLALATNKGALQVTF